MAARPRRLAVAAATTLALLLPALAATATPADAPATATPADTAASAADTGVDLAAAEGRVLVRWTEGVGPSDRRRVLDAQAPGRTATAAVTDRVDAVEVAAPTDGLVDRLAAAPEIELAEPDRVLTTTSGPDVADRPDDPLFGVQWGLENTGQTVGPDTARITGEPGVDVRARQAWAHTRGHDRVVVAVIDTAIEDSHVDLAGAVVDEIETLSGSVDAERDHGTAVASVIAARADDGFGMAGLAPEVSVLSIAAFGSIDNGPGSSTLASVVEAFDVAAGAGAHVINASWVTDVDSPLLRSAVADAGVPVVAASGNDERVLTPDASVYPAGYDLPNVVSVTAVDPRGRVPAFANVGAEVVDVGAPGVVVPVATPDGGHAWGEGTSFAAPHVAAALALAVAVAPYATTRDLVDAVSWTSRVEASLIDRTRTGGMLDAGRLVAGVQRPVCRRDLLPPSDFADVSEGNLHRVGIDCLVALDVASGRPDGTFAPAASVTREQMATVLYGIVQSVLDLPPAESAGFVDVHPDGTHTGAIDGLAALGIVRGDADGRFRPREPVTRAQMATLLVQTHDLLLSAPQPPSRRWFDDTAASVHVDTIDRARDLGLTRGIDRVRFDPGSPIRRDQMASLVAGAIDALAREGVVEP